ncbi:MAG: DUF1559 domain-containing protein, partial [Planctomycetaceae bacterium]
SVNESADQPEQSNSLISSYHTGGGQVLLADGSVRYVSTMIDPDVLAGLFTKSGAEATAEW